MLDWFGLEVFMNVLKPVCFSKSHIYFPCASLESRISDFSYYLILQRVFPDSSVGKESACNAETGVQFPGQEATVRTGHGTADWFQTGKGGRQGCILSHCLFNLYAEYVMRNIGLEDKLESILPGEISITSDMQMTSPLWQKVKKN